jgi:hypothetical protein
MLVQNTERYVGKKDACRILGVAPSTIVRWSDPESKYYKPGIPENQNKGGHWKLWLPALLEWMRRRTSQT